MRKKKITIEYLQEIAISHGGRCLSKKYLGYTIKHQWECSRKHTWSALANTIKGGNTWCPICAGNIQLTIQEMQILASAKGGKCLSSEYINYETLLTWECALKHIWQASGGSIKYNKSWCPECAGNAKYSIKDMNLLAEANGGRCISNTYKGIHSKLEWECYLGHNWKSSPIVMFLKENYCTVCFNINRWKTEINNIATCNGGKCLTNTIYSNKDKINLECRQGHKWISSFRSVKEGSWCPECVKCKKLTIEDYHNLAAENNGKCLAYNTVEYRQNVKWECDKGHQWETRIDVVKSGAWCKICSNENRRRTIEEMQEIAKFRGGLCLSDKYEVGNLKLNWRCKNNHAWAATANSIVSGSWCPMCESSTIEDLCREIFENFFKKPFPSGRYSWLKNDKTNANLELDGYCAELNIAFEYQGLQHYEKIDCFKMTDEDLDNMKYRDSLKVKICAENNIKLFVIKPVPKNSSKDNTRELIFNLLKQI